MRTIRARLRSERRGLGTAGESLRTVFIAFLLPFRSLRTKEGRRKGRPSGYSFGARLGRRRLRSAVALLDRRRLVLLGKLLCYELAGDSAAILSDLLVSHCCRPRDSWVKSLRLPKGTPSPPKEGVLGGPVSGEVEDLRRCFTK